MIIKRLDVLTLQELVDLARSLALVIACGIAVSPLRFNGVQPPQFIKVALALVGFVIVTYTYEKINEAKKRRKTRRDKAIVL